MYTLTLADGTKIENLGMNGDNLISQEPVDETLFEGNLSTITISDGETTEVRHNVEYTGQMLGPGGWYFAFAEIPPQELVNIAVNGKLDYIAMMTDVDLEEV